MDSLKKLAEIFNNGSADSEKDFLIDVFVPSEDFNDIISFQSNTCRLLIGNKGSGKSAVLEYIDLNCKKNSIYSIYLTPDEILEEDFDENVSIAIITKTLQKTIINTIAARVGENLKGLLSEEDNALLQTSINSGNKNDTFFNKLINVLSPIGTAITDIDFDKMLEKPDYTSTYFIRAINSHLNSNDKIIYVLFDDMDQISSISNANYYDVIWGALLAIQKIATKLPNIRPIITLRTEVWRNVSNNANGNRDQIDHIRPMIRNINPTSNDIREILKKRLAYCVKSLAITSYDYFTVFFEGKKCKVPRSEQTRSWEDFLVTSSRERPRDTVQLVQHLATSALKAGNKFITSDDVESTAYIYSQERFKDIVSENQDLCEKIETIIRTFIDMGFELDANTLLNHLKKVPSSTSIRIQKKTLRPDNIEDALEIWHLLYNIEFLTPRIADNTKDSQYRYIRPYEDTTLVTAGRWNDMQKYIWDVHPCYRVFLMQEHDNKLKTILPATNNPYAKGKSVKKRL